jgi:hypothetical protein
LGIGLSWGVVVVRENEGELPGALDFEVFEVGGFGFVEFVFDDVVDTAAAGAFLELGAEVGEVFGEAGGDDLDGTVVGVADPAAEAQFRGFAVDEPAEADALYAATDEEVEDHEAEVSVSHGRAARQAGPVFTAAARLQGAALHLTIRGLRPAPDSPQIWRI